MKEVLRMIIELGNRYAAAVVEIERLRNTNNEYSVKIRELYKRAIKLQDIVDKATIEKAKRGG